MKKPQLVILRKVNEMPVLGGCSSCQGITFDTGSPIGTISEHQWKLEKLFREHFKTVHMHEDASQAAARIVREATRD